MELAYRRLSDVEVEQGLTALPEWKREGDHIAKTFSFPTYKDGVVFASAVGFLADALNHHPDLMIGYGRVTVRMNTHDVGGLSPYDLELARRIETLGA